MRQVIVVFLLVLGATILAAMSMSLGSFGITGTAKVYAAPGGAPPQPTGCDSETNAVVLKLTDGADISTINDKYDTQTARSFPGTTIYVVLTSGGAKATNVAGRMARNKKVVWAEAGQFSGDPDAIYDPNASATQFSPASPDQFNAAALDQFSQAALDQFSTAALDQFSIAALDQFTQAALDQFTQAALEQFSQAALDQFSTAALDQFSIAVLDQFSTAILDQFSASILDQFTAAVLDQFAQAALDQFSQAALDQFSTAIMDQFSTAIMDQFTVAMLDQFSTAALDQFSAAIMDQFSTAVLDQFTTAIMDQFTQAALDQFSATILDQFTQAVLDQFTQAVLDQFTAAALDQFSQAVLDQFSAASLDQFLQSILDTFDGAFFDTLLIDTLDAVYGNKARSQEALSLINTDAAHAMGTGRDVMVAVIDTGITDHWFFRGKIASGGFDYVDGDNQPIDVANGIDENGNGTADEGWGHGTHVAGIISLLAPDAKILPIRVQNAEGDGWSFIVAEAIQYATDSGAHVINLSLNVPCESKVLEWAVNYARERSVVVVAAAGNEDLSTVGYPARYAGVVAVAAVDNSDIKASFSNFGDAVTVSAPGVDIYSAYGNGLFAWWSGTSQSAPIVAGESALILGAYPWLTTDEVSAVVADSAANIDSLNPGYEGLLGSGRVDLSAALASVTGGHEIRVSSTVSGDQKTPNHRAKSVDTDADGDFVAVWASDQTGTWDVYVQRFNSLGLSQGPEFRVNTTTSGSQYHPSVAMDATGGFVVAWQDVLTIYGRRFDATGVPLSGEFQVNTDTGGLKERPSVAMEGDGDFVIVWTAVNQDPDGSAGIYAQMYGADGSTVGTEFQVNTAYEGGQWDPVVAMDDSGGFVVSWSPSIGGAFAQRYDTAGTPLGGEFQVNTTAISTKGAPSIGMSNDGRFVIAWEAPGNDSGNSYGVFAQRYSANGAPQGGEFRVNTELSGDQSGASVSMDANANFVITWKSAGQDYGNTWGVFGQRYDSNGSPIGGESLVNTTIASDQVNASVAMDDQGDYVVVWSGNGISDSDGIFGTVYD
ncbi:MAG: S8 family serine peptidase [Chloroflexi bacterium]|nr:S8 family serine peptidase [Chloroflexota bacterium]